VGLISRFYSSGFPFYKIISQILRFFGGFSNILFLFSVLSFFLSPFFTFIHRFFSRDSFFGAL